MARGVNFCASKGKKRQENRKAGRKWKLESVADRFSAFVVMESATHRPLKMYMYITHNTVRTHHMQKGGRCKMPFKSDTKYGLSGEEQRRINVYPHARFLSFKNNNIFCRLHALWKSVFLYLFRAAKADLVPEYSRGIVQRLCAAA
jgi:hypothetical protein